MYEPARLCFILDNFDVLEKWKGMIDCMEPWMGRTAAVVDLGMLKNNLAEIRKKLKPGVELMAEASDEELLVDKYIQYKIVGELSDNELMDVWSQMRL